MKIYTLCVDPEHGKYLAVSCEDHTIRAVSYTSEDEALGALVRLHPKIQVEMVISLNRDDEKDLTTLWRSAYHDRLIKREYASDESQTPIP